MRSDTIAVNPCNRSVIMPSSRIHLAKEATLCIMSRLDFFTDITFLCDYQCNLVKDQRVSEEHPAGAADAKEISSSVSLKDATEASLDANAAMCNNALLDILVSEKFALLCDLLVKTFHVNKVHEVIDLAKIDTNMRNGNYAQNPELFNDDIQQVALSESFIVIGKS